ncbi:MAG: transposase family protein [Nitrospirae bacterium]|nr:transposase family protein [Nitrospirota bacterium]
MLPQHRDQSPKGIESHKKQLIEELSLKNPEYGHKKIWALMRFRHDVEITKYGTYEAMKEMGLLLPSNYTQELKTQIQARKQYLHKPEGINQLWQVDFTEFEIRDYGTYYSTNVMDYFSRYVLACLIRQSHTAEDLIEAIEMAKRESVSVIGGECFPEKVLLVSDQGPAMKSKTFRKYIQGSLFKHILARGHHPQTIGMLERFNESQKYERIYRREYTDPIDAEMDLEVYRIKYNTYRPHEALGYDVPANIYQLNNMVGLTLNSK